MSAMLVKFQSMFHVSVDPALAQRWDYDVRANGEKNIKLQIAQAKRTATTLHKASLQFSNIRPEQELAIKAAASAMRALANELVPMLAWAKAYKKFCDAQDPREKAEQLEATASARWGHDAVALQFEADLIQELSTADGRPLPNGSIPKAGTRMLRCKISRRAWGTSARDERCASAWRRRSRTKRGKRTTNGRP